jgi:RNA polymerase sigma-70 factor, ECF subfamily
MKESSDEDIARIVQSGDSEAFGELVTRYEVKLKRYARKFLSREEDAEDLVQEVFIKAYTNIQSYDSTFRFSPWIYRIAHNTFVNELRKKRRYSTGIFDADVLLPLLPAKETTDAPAIDSEIRREIDQVLETLPPKYREVIVLYYFEDVSYQEISDILQIPVTTVGVRMTRARAKLHEALKSKSNI